MLLRSLLLFAISLLLLLPLAGRLWERLLRLLSRHPLLRICLISLIAALTELAPQAQGSG
ncbi:MAG: hypothetical protein H6638_11000 [Ardenticatenales bacterium]|nr:hypothetical protein [Ardenticatenales bacterium]